MDLSVVPYGAPVGGGARRGEGEARYRECLRNHAAAMGGQAFDGCGEFMPGGGDGDVEGDELKCAACGCHRNFHRREGGGGAVDHRRSTQPLLLYGAPWDRPKTTAQATLPPFFPPPPHAAVSMPYHPLHPPSCHNREGSETPPPPQAPGVTGSEDRRHGDECGRKRYRTKFTPEQKERMREFAERLGWRIQKHDGAALDEFCLEIGVKRHVLKVWMHNNKHSLSSSPSSSSSLPNPNRNLDSNPGHQDRSPPSPIQV